MARQLRIDIALETGAVTETVNVAGQTPLLETETGTLSSTIENRQVVSLPTLGRNPQDFRAWYDLGYIYRATNRSDEALSAYRRWSR